MTNKLGVALCEALGIANQRVSRLVIDCTIEHTEVTATFLLSPSVDLSAPPPNPPAEIVTAVRRYKLVPIEGEG